jgi:hypothetical protein
MLKFRTLTVFAALSAISSVAFGQPRKYVFMTRDFQVSLVPGVNSNGLNSAQYFNKISLNLLAGLSAGNRILEVGVISNASTFRVTGIQIAGIANVVGTNSFLVEPDEKLRSRDEEKFTAKFHGLQFAGVINYVNESATGLQFSGMINATRKEVKGMQLSGIGNTAGGPTNGVQLAGLYNLSGETMSGVQVSLLLNVTHEFFSGTQLGLINKAKETGGKNTLPYTKARGLQLGLINLNRKMNGLQVGLINLGGAARGVQFGLINFYKQMPSKENVKQGIPIGLLNFTSRGPDARVYNTEMFPLSVEYSTGQCRNCSAAESQMPFEGKNQVYYHNSLIVGSNPFRSLWAFGYGFERMLFNKKTMMKSSANKTRVIAYGIKFRYLYNSNVNNRFDLLSSVNFDYGKRLGRVYVFGSVTINHFLYKDSSFEGLPSWASTIKSSERNSQAFWPGYGVGLLY